MNTKALKALVGLTVAKAEAAVRKAGLEPESLTEDQIVPDITLPRNVVRLRFNTQNKVVSAETQASIDAKYQ